MHELRGQPNGVPPIERDTFVRSSASPHRDRPTGCSKWLQLGCQQHAGSWARRRRKAEFKTKRRRRFEGACRQNKEEQDEEENVVIDKALVNELSMNYHQCNRQCHFENYPRKSDHRDHSREQISGDSSSQGVNLAECQIIKLVCCRACKASAQNNNNNNNFELSANSASCLKIAPASFKRKAANPCFKINVTFTLLMFITILFSTDYNIDQITYDGQFCDGLGNLLLCEQSLSTNRIDFTNAQLKQQQLLFKETNKRNIYQHENSELGLTRSLEKTGDRKEADKSWQEACVTRTNSLAHLTRNILSLFKPRSPLILLASANSDANRLYEDLMMTYNKIVRPVQNESERVVVTISLKLSQLIDVVSVA